MILRSATAASIEMLEVLQAASMLHDMDSVFYASPSTCKKNECNHQEEEPQEVAGGCMIKNKALDDGAKPISTCKSSSAQRCSPSNSQLS